MEDNLIKEIYRIKEMMLLEQPAPVANKVKNFLLDLISKGATHEGEIESLIKRNKTKDIVRKGINNITEEEAIRILKDIWVNLKISF